ncbi:tyrosine-type recombinase/integrase [Deinococcus ruber]|uniref:tyrosine-type recombinase/integrase n=1 Tax=Deinococcus ruber TaxID=1848197 RepID=UPI0035716147
MDAVVRVGMDASKINPHKLRHAFTATLVEGGRSVHEVRDVLRHESIATPQIYAPQPEVHSGGSHSTGCGKPLITSQTFSMLVDI